LQIYIHYLNSNYGLYSLFAFLKLETSNAFNFTHREVHTLANDSNTKHIVYFVNFASNQNTPQRKIISLANKRLQKKRRLDVLNPDRHKKQSKYSNFGQHYKLTITINIKPNNSPACLFIEISFKTLLPQETISRARESLKPFPG